METGALGRFLKKIKKGNKREEPGSFNRRLNKTRDWEIMLIFFFVLIIIVFALSYYVYTSVVDEDQREVPIDEISYRVIDKRELRSVIDKFDERSRNFENVLQNEPDIVDPSL